MPLEYQNTVHRTVKMKVPDHMRRPVGNFLYPGHGLVDATWTSTKNNSQPYHCERCYGPPVITHNGVPIPYRRAR